MLRCQKQAGNAINIDFLHLRNYCCGVSCPAHIELTDVSRIIVPHELIARVGSWAKRVGGRSAFLALLRFKPVPILIDILMLLTMWLTKSSCQQSIVNYPLSNKMEFKVDNMMLLSATSFNVRMRVVWKDSFPSDSFTLCANFHDV